jgi:hypothetical protein
VTGQASVEFGEGMDPYTAHLLRQRGHVGGGGGEDEATSPIPGPVTAVANVQAKFRAK